MNIYRGDLYRKATKKRLNTRYRDAMLNGLFLLLFVGLVALILWDTFREGGNFDVYFGLVNHGH